MSRACAKWLLGALAVCTLVVGTGAGPARASFGELGHFGAAGSGNGQFVESNDATNAFGVDPTDNSVYVGDRPKEGKAGEFRIQKLSAAEKGKFVASVSIPITSRFTGIQGIAIDPSRGVLYVLGIQTRPDEEEQEKQGGAIVDPERTAASALYAFSTTASGTKLVPAKEANQTTGVLVAAAALQPQSKTPGESLLEPKGVAVDATSGDIILLGREDHTGEGEDFRVALERFAPTGAKVEPQFRYVDTTAFFGAEESAETSSPAVTPTGKVYVVGGGGVQAENTEQIDEIPSTFNSGEAPKPLIEFDSGLNEVVTFPGLPPPNDGDALSIAADGTIYAYAGIRRLEVKEKSETYGTPHPGALAFTAAGQEIGWTGGAVWTKESAPACSISFLGHPLVAAGSGGHIFIFDSNSEAPNVVDFGPEGKGCPEASATAPTATIEGQPVNGPRPAGSKITLSSSVPLANALSVEWNFGDGTSETVNADQHQITEVTHAFSVGEHIVTETIHTDDLASPTITETAQKTKLTVTLKIEPGPPTAQFKAPLSANVSESVPFDGKGSSDPNGTEGLPLTYAWNFGDGSAPTSPTTSPTASHGYAAAGTYTVTLTVADKLGKKASVAHQIVVSQPEPSPNPGPGPGPAPGPGPSPGPPPGGGVLAYQASFAGTSLTVAPSGAFAIRVDCVGPSSCTGTVTLRTLSAVSAAAGKRKSILTLASGSFTATGGQVKAITLHLSAKAKRLLARVHVVRARATILGRDTSGATHTTQATVTLRPAKRKHH